MDLHEHTLSVNDSTTDDNNKTADQTTSSNAASSRIARAQWLRAAILGANDGLLSTALLMLGVSSAKEGDRMSVVVSGVAGAIAGAFSMAVGEFVSVSAQRDIETEIKKSNSKIAKEKEEDNKILLNPTKAAAASGSSFLVGSAVPLLSGAFVRQYQARVMVLVAATTVALVTFGGLVAHLGGSGRVGMSASRVLIGGWLAMGMTFWLLKLLDNDEK